MLRECSVTLLVIVALLLGAPVGAWAADAPLADAVQRVDHAVVERLLQGPIDVNATQADGMTALHWAGYHDDVELARTLLQAGADAAAASRYGVTPLSLACTNGNVAMVELLLDAGAHPNTTLPGGETALMTAARTGEVRVVRALLAKGADAHAEEDRRGQTALMWAAAEGHADVVGVLLEIGADFRTPLESGFTPLLFAAREGRTDVVRALLAAGASVNGMVQREGERKPVPGGRMLRNGTSPLLVAVTNAHFDLGTMLLGAGADPNAADTGYTALHALASARKPGVGDNNPAPDGSGAMTSLQLARKLVAAGADVNAAMTKRANLNNTRFNELGATPFMLASLTADAEYMQLLIEFGADITVRNAENSTALMAASGLGTRSPGEDAGTEPEVLEALQVLVELGADVNAVDSNFETPMHSAAYKNLPKVVEFLALHGADIEIWNQENTFGWTPLTIARGYRFGNFKPSAVTVAAVEGVMLAAGVTPPTEDEEKAESVDIYTPKPKPSAKKPPR